MNQTVEQIAHRDLKRRCLDCVEHGAPFDGPCSGCGYADPRWVSQALMNRFDRHLQEQGS